MKFKILFFFFGISLAAFAQERGNCGCSLNLKEIITDIEANYPGYKVKTNTGKLSAYISVKKDVINDASKITTREGCFYTIAKYLSFFKDNHIIFVDNKTTPKQALLKDVNLNKTQRDELTGIWQRVSDSLTVKIIKEDKSTYKAYISKTTQSYGHIGNVHFALIGNENEFKIRKYSGWLTTALLRGRRLDQLLIEPDGIWEKVNGIDHKARQVKLGTTNKVFTYQPIDKSTYYLGIPAFNVNEKKFDSLIVNKIIPEILDSKTKHLIIDLRNNTGGNGSFLFLTRLIYDKPFAIPGDFIYATPTMVSKYQILADGGSAYHKMMLPKLIANIGGFVQRDSLHVKMSKIYDYPQKVSIIVNENCGSSTEYFLLIAKHSSKVKIFGRHTSGTLDYSELFSSEKLSCAEYSYMRPTSKAFYADARPIDNKGILPDVDLSKYPDDEWIDIVISKQIQ